jgi:hypothetical protein
LAIADDMLAINDRASGWQVGQEGRQALLSFDLRQSR